MYLAAFQYGQTCCGQWSVSSDLHPLLARDSFDNVHVRIDLGAISLEEQDELMMV